MSIVRTQAMQQLNKVGIIGSRNITRRRDIIELLYKLKGQFGHTLMVISGGNMEGIELDVKELCLSMGIAYKEFNPSFTGKNEHSYLWEQYYGLPYHVSHFGHRYLELVKHCDVLFVYQSPEDKKFYAPFVKKAQKKGTNVAVIE
jgi:hypothetical protein